MSSYRTIQEECCEANIALPGFRLVDLTFGNVSVADPQTGVFAIKPSGVGYRELKPEQMVIVDYDGKVVEGSLRPPRTLPRIGGSSWPSRISVPSYTPTHDPP